MTPPRSASARPAKGADARPTAPPVAPAPGVAAGPATGPFGSGVDRIDFGHIVYVLRKWAALILGGVLVVVILSVLIARLNRPAYEAEGVVFFDQPRFTAHPDTGRPTVQKLLALGTTFAEFATSDQVLGEVKVSLKTKASLKTLRSRVTVVSVANTTTLRVMGRDQRKSVSERLVVSVQKALGEQLKNYQVVSNVLVADQFTVTPLRSPLATRPGSNAARTIVLTTLLGGIVMVGVAFLLEYIERDPDEDADLTTA